ncbi:MAG: UDP-N-acetylglucosamine 1-carboxyvinyltransferase, partial [Clostridia bacterium]|nr:UDP-N-acetylglucosamine 1-carboxyvinyltransferase [Clostridia bacterium]
MGRFIIEGGHPLNGTLKVQGAKNAALPILAAGIMSRGEVTLTNCPCIRDVDNMLDILGELGAGVERLGDTIKLSPGNASRCVMPNRLSKELRSSIFMLGPLLSRFGRAVCTYPGGCEIGHRPIDLHLRGLAALGADIREERGRIVCEGKQLHGADIHLDYPSVGATENIMMAAASAKGDTCITNAAREPEIEDLQNFLNAIGCSIWGAGTSTLYIRGGMEHVPSAVYRIMPDRIAAGTILCAVAMAGGNVTLTDVCCDHMGAALAKLKEAGCELLQRGDSVTIKMMGRPREIKLIETFPYPGFPTDMQAQF